MQLFATHYWLPREVTSEKQAQKWHYPDLDSDTSSVWHFCVRFSDVIWQGNQWWRREMSAFSQAGNNDDTAADDVYNEDVDGGGGGGDAD